MYPNATGIVNKTALKRYSCKTKKSPTKKKGGISPGAVHLNKKTSPVATGGHGERHTGCENQTIICGAFGERGDRNYNDRAKSGNN